jgi:ABC-type sugar transport system, permease component
MSTKITMVNSMERKVRRSLLDHSFKFITVTIITIFAFTCVYPFWYILIYSLSDPAAVVQGLGFLPKGFTLENYRMIFSLNQIWNAVFISALRAVFGTAITLFFSSMYAYVLSKSIRGHKVIYRMLIITMYVNGGLIPFILVMRMYGLYNNFWVYILPSAVSAYYVILIKTYMEQLPSSLEDSALIDGANYFIIFYRVILPLSVPVLAAVCVFSAVGQWNAWSDNLYLVKNSKLGTLQLLLLNLLQQADALAKIYQTEHNIDLVKNLHITPMTLRMAMTVVSIVPIFVAYPFLQKYFVKGILMGAIKG